jgi:rubrerythrin
MNMKYPPEIYEIEDSKEIESLWDMFSNPDDINPCMWCGAEVEDLSDDICPTCTAKHEAKMREYCAKHNLNYQSIINI